MLKAILIYELIGLGFIVYSLGVTLQSPRWSLTEFQKSTIRNGWEVRSWLWHVQTTPLLLLIFTIAWIHTKVFEREPMRH